MSYFTEYMLSDIAKIEPKCRIDPNLATITGMVTPGRFELPTCGLGNRRSIHLSYGANADSTVAEPVGADDGSDADTVRNTRMIAFANGLKHRAYRR